MSYSFVDDADEVVDDASVALGVKTMELQLSVPLLGVCPTIA
ncbi:MAG TPA: hypothetical protein VKA40_08735 [Nitrososphaera sp.]|nr:hypothetical protein [Nitrososphaera sp.]